MDERLLVDNRHRENPISFSERDSHLQQLKSWPVIYTFPQLDQFPTTTPGIYTLSGTHWTGKTTLLKCWMEKLLKNGINPHTITYFSGNEIKDQHDLYTLIKNQLTESSPENLAYLIIDDISMISDWPKAIQALKQERCLTHAILMLSSAYLTLPNMIQESKSHFNLQPLSFRETVTLKVGHTKDPEVLYKEFNDYLQHGGYLIAINEMALHGHILDKTLISYINWIRDEVIRHGKRENYLREILQAIVQHYNEQITWNALVKKLSIDHPKTIGDYLALLESLGLVFIQYALLETLLKPAPKKARKLMFTDPFLFHAVRAWLSHSKLFFETQIKNSLDDIELASHLAETCAVMQFQRIHPTYYIKAEGDVTLAYIQRERFWPVEIIWSSQIRTKDLKKILKYSNARILTKTARTGIIEHIKTEPLPFALWQLKKEQP